MQIRLYLLLIACAFLAFVPRWTSAQGQPTAYYVEVDPDSFDYIIEHPWEDHYVPVTVTLDGQTRTDARMRIRGDSSRGRDKKSFKLQFDGAPLPDGTRTLNLNGDYLDRSYLHTVLSSILIRRSGQPVFDARHVDLYVNGSFYGLYVQVENVDEAFLERVGLDARGDLYKAALDGACMSPFDDVFYHWDKESGARPGRGDLESLIRAINAVPQATYEDFVRAHFAYDELINVLAINMLIANGSTYYHNYFLHHESGDSGRWRYLHWDTDYTFSSYGTGESYQRSSGSSTPDNPLLERAVLSDEMLADIRERIEVLANDFYNPETVNPIIDSLAAAIRASVERDQIDQVSGLNEWQSNVLAEKAFIAGRPASLLRQIDLYPRSFRLDREPTIDASGITFRWTPSRSPGDDPIQYTFRFGTSPRFSSGSDVIVSGLEDTTFTLAPLPPPGQYFWHVQARDSTRRIDGYDTWNPILVGGAGRAPLVINEIMYSSGDAVGSSDWIELLNPLEEVVELEGWSIRDENNSFRFPDEAAIEAGGFIVLARDVAAFQAYYGERDDVIGDIGFGIASGGETLRLFNPAAELIDSVQFSPEPPWPQEAAGTGASIELLDPARDNAAGENWRASLAVGGTPGLPNSVNVTGGEEPFPYDKPVVATIYPNPFHTNARIELSLNHAAHVAIQVADVLGRRLLVLVDRRIDAGRCVVNWDGRALPSGLYFYTVLVDGKPLSHGSAVHLR